MFWRLLITRGVDSDVLYVVVGRLLMEEGIKLRGHCDVFEYDEGFGQQKVIVSGLEVDGVFIDRLGSFTFTRDRWLECIAHRGFMNPSWAEGEYAFEFDPMSEIYQQITSVLSSCLQARSELSRLDLEQGTAHTNNKISKTPRL